MVTPECRPYTVWSLTRESAHDPPRPTRRHRPEQAVLTPLPRGAGVGDRGVRRRDAAGRSGPEAVPGLPRRLPGEVGADRRGRRLRRSGLGLRLPEEADAPAGGRGD